MTFTNDDDVKAYVNRQLSRAKGLPTGPFYAFIRPQWRYRHLAASEMDLGHLEWKIYRKADLGQFGGDVPSLEIMEEMGMFGYWALRISSDYRFFFFVHGNSSAGAWDTDKAFDHGSMLAVSQVTEDGNEALSTYIEHILITYGENRYYLS